jgi:hypothetical protein
MLKRNLFTTHDSTTDFSVIHNLTETWDSSIGIERATNRTARVRFLRGVSCFSSVYGSDRLWGPPSLLSCNGDSFAVGKGEGGRTDHSLPLTAEVKNGVNIAPLPNPSSWRSA